MDAEEIKNDSNQRKDPENLNQIDLEMPESDSNEEHTE